MALHLYGVTWAGAGLPTGVTGRADAELRTIEAEDLAVVVSEVDPDRPAGPGDLLSHARVLEAIAATDTVVPVQFGVLLFDDVQVHEEMLQPEAESLRHLLRAFDGMVQLTVQASHEEEPALAQVLEREPGLRAMRDAVRGAGAAATQGEQVALGQAVSDALERLAGHDRDVILDQLDPVVEAVSLSEPGSALQVLNAAVLVERGRRQELDEAVEHCRSLLGARMRIRYVGPQPPYSFVDSVRTGELAWS